MKIFLHSLFIICLLVIPLCKNTLLANHSNLIEYASSEIRATEYTKPIQPQKPKSKKHKKNKNKNKALQYNSFWWILLAAIGLILLPLGIGLEITGLGIAAAVILGILFIMTIITMAKTRKKSIDSLGDSRKNKILLLSSIFLTLLGVSLIIAGILGNILALWIIGAVLVLPGIVWIIILLQRQKNL